MLIGQAAASVPSIPEAEPAELVADGVAECEAAAAAADDDLLGFVPDSLSDVDDILRDDFHAGLEVDKEMVDALLGEEDAEGENQVRDADEGGIVLGEADDNVLEDDHVLHPSSFTLVPEHEMDERGYVVSPAEPWVQWPAVGRITTWPSTKPVDLRSVSCRCSLHHECRTPASRRALVSDEFLIRWLFSGTVPEPMCTLGRSRELVAAHMAQFAPMFDAFRSHEER